MTNIKLQEAFEREVGVLDNNIVKPSTSDIEYWLNNSIEKFWKTRYSGTNFRRESFEQTQKRMDDLRTLVAKKVYPLTETTEEYTIELPSDYLITLGETAVIYSNDACWPMHNGMPRTKHVDVTEATIENFDAKKNNTFSTHRLHNNTARPLRLMSGNTINLYTDGNYYLKQYILTYLKKPKNVDLVNSPFEEYTDLPSHTHEEFVKLAAHRYLENQANARYETYSNEVNLSE